MEEIQANACNAVPQRMVVQVLKRSRLRCRQLVKLLVLSIVVAAYPATNVHAGISVSIDAMDGKRNQSAETTKVSIVPARLRTDKWSLASQINFPEGKEDLVVTVRCNIYVSWKGRPSTGFCLPGADKSGRFERNIIKAVTRSKMFPAKVGDDAVDVTFGFTTIFERKNGQETIYVVPNQFLNAEEFGASYEDPQLILDSFSRTPRACWQSTLVIRSRIERDGSVADIVLHQGDESAQGCFRVARRWMVDWKFIPGFVNGEATPMNTLVFLDWRKDWIFSFPSILIGGVHDKSGDAGTMDCTRVPVARLENYTPGGNIGC